MLESAAEPSLVFIDARFIAEPRLDPFALYNRTGVRAYFVRKQTRQFRGQDAIDYWRLEHVQARLELDQPTSSRRCPCDQDVLELTRLVL